MVSSSLVDQQLVSIEGNEWWHLPWWTSSWPALKGMVASSLVDQQLVSIEENGVIFLGGPAVGQH